MSVWVEIQGHSTMNLFHYRHAPRERVSWNFAKITYINNCSSHAPRERVSWNNISWALLRNSTLSRSTWACELKSERSSFSGMVIASRSTWACELKCPYHSLSAYLWSGHAPRERVSWNVSTYFSTGFLYVTLHVSVWVEILFLLCYPKNMVVTLHVSVWVEITVIIL